MGLAAILDSIARPLDVLRRQCLVALSAWPTLRAMMRHRSHRLTALVTAHAVIAFAVAVLFPIVLFLLGPILLGAAHIAADVRYLVLRRTLTKPWRQTVWVMCVALVGLRLWEESRGDAGVWEFSVVFAWGILAIGAALMEPRLPNLHTPLEAAAYSPKQGRLAPIAWRAGTALGAWLLCGTVALRAPDLTRLVFAHLHNIVGFVAWFYLSPRGGKSWACVVGVLAAASILASGSLSAMTLASPGASNFDVHVLQVADWLAPGAAAQTGIGLVCAYVFMQSVHYMVWLGVIPQQDSTATRTLSFRMSMKSLQRDLGTPGVVLTGVAILTVAGCAVLRLSTTRDVFLSLTSFHGYLELAMLTYLWVRDDR